MVVVTPPTVDRTLNPPVSSVVRIAPEEAFMAMAQRPVNVADREGPSPTPATPVPAMVVTDHTEASS